MISFIFFYSCGSSRYPFFVNYILSISITFLFSLFVSFNIFSLISCFFNHLFFLFLFQIDALLSIFSFFLHPDFLVFLFFPSLISPRDLTLFYSSCFSSYSHFLGRTTSGVRLQLFPARKSERRRNTWEGFLVSQHQPATPHCHTPSPQEVTTRDVTRQSRCDGW